MKKEIVLIGAGGHAKVIADCIRLSGQYDILGFLSADKSRSNDLNIIGDDSCIPKLISEGHRTFFVAIGDNYVRWRVVNTLLSFNASLPSITHPSSTIASSVNLGPGSVIMPGAVLNSDTHVGIGCVINTLAGVDHDCKIGDGAFIGPGSSIAGDVSVGQLTFIGAGSTIIPKISIGSECIIGAGSVVVRDIPDGTKSMGVPARVIAKP